MGKRSRQTRRVGSRAAQVAPEPGQQHFAETHASDPARLLLEVRGLVESIALEEARRDELVVAARGAGCTWVELAGALGVSPQAVHKRFGSRSC
jgi:hypothetical protein